MRRPNILLIYTDQLRWDALRCNGNPHAKTPNLDRLAADGLSFDHFFVQNPVCMPSRLSLLAGQYPSTLRVTHMGVPVPEDTVILPGLLSPYGYVTANIGKLHFLPHANRDHRAPHPRYGFDQLEISDEPGCYEDAYRAWVKRKAPEYLDVVSPGLPPAAAVWYRAMGVRDTVRHPDERFPKAEIPFRAPSELTHSAFVAEQSAEFIRQQGARPWLCIASFYSPHSPWVAPQEFLDLYDADVLPLPPLSPEMEAKRRGGELTDDVLRHAARGYYAMVSEVDHHVGRLLALLDALDLADDTIVLFTSDHGEWLGEQLKFGKGHPGNDPVSRVPLLARWPAYVRSPGRTESGIAEGVDVLPTLLEAAAIQVPPHVQGRSLLPAFRDGPFAGRESALMEQRGWKSLRTRRYRYVCESDGRELLWDLESDPRELSDVASQPVYAAALAELRRQLLVRVLQNEQPLPRVWNY